jgi:hypothetical protein
MTVGSVRMVRFRQHTSYNTGDGAGADYSRGWDAEEAPERKDVSRSRPSDKGRRQKPTPKGKGRGAHGFRRAVQKRTRAVEASGLELMGLDPSDLTAKGDWDAMHQDELQTHVFLHGAREAAEADTPNAGAGTKELTPEARVAAMLASDPGPGAADF